MVKYEIIKERDPTIEDRLAAAACLSGAGFKLYCYLESFTWGATSYSRKDFVDKINISLKTANTAFEELIEKGYLTSYSATTYRFGNFF